VAHRLSETLVKQQQAEPQPKGINYMKQFEVGRNGGGVQEIEASIQGDRGWGLQEFLQTIAFYLPNSGFEDALCFCYTQEARPIG